MLPPERVNATAEGEAPRQASVLEPAYSAVGGGPNAPEAIAGDDTWPRPIVIEPKSSGGGWLVIVGPRAAPRLRLFCFPFAGGGSAVYRRWAQSIDPSIEVVAIEPPGRLGRITETPVADMDEFVDRLVPEIARTTMEDELHLAAEQFAVEICRHRQLRVALLKGNA